MVNTQKRVPVARALAHVEALIEALPTVTTGHIANLAGVHRGTIRHLRFNDNITAEIEERILAVTPRHLRLIPPRHVPKGAAVAHARRLLAHEGVTYAVIGRAAGLSSETIRSLDNGRGKTCHYRTHVAVMGVTVDQVLGGVGWVPIGPVATRIRALEAAGWSRSTQTAMCGVACRSVANRGNTRTSVTAATASAVKAMYDRIGDATGPDEQCRRTALAAGAKTPIHYDEDMNLIEVEDTDGAAQDHARIFLVIAGMSIEGMFPVDIGERIGMNRDAVATIRARSGLRSIPGADPERVVFKPGSEPLIARIEALMDGIEVRERTDVLDAPGIDYVARWATLTEPVLAERKQRERMTTAA